jgi:hypothetical protein
MPNPVTELPKVAELEQEFWAEITDPEARRASWYRAAELVKNQITWLEYVPEGELIDSEVERLNAALCKAYVSLRRLTARYID